VNWNFWLPIFLPLSSLVTALLILVIRENQHRLRTFVNLLGATLKIVMVAVVGYGVYTQHAYEARMPLSLTLDLVLRVDDISLLFLALSSTLWFLTTIFAVGYLEGSPHQSRFFCFFSLCMTATMGISLAGNLITFLIFYEMLTLATYPLIVHRGTEKALRAGRIYLAYTLVGGAVTLAGTAWIHTLVGPTQFAHGGVLAPLAPTHRHQLQAIFTLMIVGLGVKAALFPLHGWLPTAMVAPAPVSALLHAVAVVKAGVFGIVRLIYDVFGVKFAVSLGVLAPLSWLAGFTIVYGSIRALFQHDLKRRLAYSTVSQLSYIVLGAAVFGASGTIGALAHLVHQGLMKITLFFCAGILGETWGIHGVDELSGIGRRMPLTMGAFTIAAFGMIGTPPMAGFVSKWYLGLGGVRAGDYWVLAVLIASSVLNCAYFLPIIHDAWFGKSRQDSVALPQRRSLVVPAAETSLPLLLPALVTAFMSLTAGLFAGSHFSPLGAARLITERMYAP